MAAIDSRELVLSGLVAYLRTPLDGLVSPDNIHASWQQANLAGRIGTGPDEQAALVILDLQNETALPNQPITNERTVVLPPAVGATRGMRVVADSTVSAPLAIICAAAGEQGETQSGQIAATVKALFGKGGTLNLPLPDDNTSDPPTWTRGIRATLLKAGGRVHTHDPIKGIYAFSVMVTAVYADYHAEEHYLVREVDIILHETLGATETTKTITRTSGP